MRVVAEVGGVSLSDCTLVDAAIIAVAAAAASALFADNVFDLVRPCNSCAWNSPALALLGMYSTQC
jgi:hypothetical protein